MRLPMGRRILARYLTNTPGCRSGVRRAAIGTLGKPDAPTFSQLPINYLKVTDGTRRVIRMRHRRPMESVGLGLYRTYRAYRDMTAGSRDGAAGIMKTWMDSSFARERRC